MNRDIKFRAWDTMAKEMYKVMGVQFYNFEAQAMFRLWLASWDNEVLNEFSDDFASFMLMQNTGLKDKNGKEIYYGDIVKGKESGYEDIIIKGWDGYRIGEVVWANGNTYYKVGNQIHQQLMYMIRPEIIGNIYENPDLLNQGEGSQRSVATEE